MCANDLQILLDFCGTPQIDAVERVKGVEPSSSAWEAEVIAVIRHPQYPPAAHCGKLENRMSIAAAPERFNRGDAFSW